MANKGGAFERELCRTLTAWWTGDAERDVIFWRTSQSGGRATSRRKKGKDTTTSHCGDITALGDEGRELTELITFEAKNGYFHATIGDSVDRPPKLKPTAFEEFLIQAIRAAENSRTPYWAVVHHRRGRDTLIYVPKDLYDDLLDVHASFPVPRMWALLDVRRDIRDLGVVGMRLDHFLEHVLPGHVRKVHNWRCK